MRVPMEDDAAALKADPGFRQLDAVRNGHVIYMTQEVQNALKSVPLGAEYVIGELQPELQKME